MISLLNCLRNSWRKRWWREEKIFAQAGGNKIDKIEDAFKVITEKLIKFFKIRVYYR